MSRRAAAFVALATRMSRQMFCRWSGAIDMLAGKPVNSSVFAVAPNNGVTVFVAFKWPDKAFILAMIEYDVFKKAFCALPFRIKAKRIAVPDPSLIMGSTKATGIVRLVASFDRALSIAHLFARWATAQRIAVSAPTMPMRIAIATSTRRLATAFNGAYRLSGHSNLRVRFNVKNAPSVTSTSARSSFVCHFSKNSRESGCTVNG